MVADGTVSEAQIGEAQGNRLRPGSLSPVQDRVIYAIYVLSFAISISLWFIDIRAPLWLDETGSYWQIAKGFSQILYRHGPVSFPPYAFILWFSTKIIGSSEIALRALSILAMLGAVYLLYLAARELFERDNAFIAAIMFCLHPIVIFAAIDVRPYSFAVLATNASILIALRLRHNNSNWLAALFGFSAACIVWFHFIFAVILPALVLCFFVVKTGQRKVFWRQFTVALAAFTLAFLPVIPGLLNLFNAGGVHVFEPVPSLGDLVLTLVPGWVLLFFGITALTLAIGIRSNQNTHYQGWQILLCISLALIPVLILFGLSKETSIHVFTPRYRLVAVPGITLCWAMLYGAIRSRVVRLLLFVGMAAVYVLYLYTSTFIWHHGYTWKYALEVVEKSASIDNAPVVICSDFPESDYATMPIDSAKDSNYFTQLSYYRLSVPVVPMPRALNGEAKRVGLQFLQEASRKHERFFALAFEASYGTLDWLAQNAAGTYSVRKLGIYDRVMVLEFDPRQNSAESSLSGSH